ncbi:hypothetical protein BKA62DRAFT_693896 [Auriculariales sp. MPI-PUGE-AT-0066]|nr:hypothetical protein BKA62DRAFT_693896 [Auriculariales sp. MPI-PUGE-AT-0066]
MADKPKPPRVQQRHAQPETTFTDLLLAPALYLANVAWAQLMSFVPYLLPVVAAALLVPMLALLSLGAGWMVWSSVPTGWRVLLDFQYGDGIPHADAFLASLVQDQVYSVSIEMLVSASAANFALGNFMTSLVLTTVTNLTVASVSRPSIITPPRTWLVSPSTIQHSLLLIPEMIPTASRLLAHVEVGRKDSWRSIGTGEGREVGIVKAWLVGHVKLSGLRAIIGAFPLTSTIVAMIAFFCISLIGLMSFTALAAYLSPRKPPQRKAVSLTYGEPEAVVKKEPVVLSLPQFSDEEGSTNSSPTDEFLVKSESDDDLPAMGLRRRQSRDVVDEDDQ